MKQMKYTLMIPVVLFLLSGTSCIREEMNPSTGQEDALERVPVRLTLNVIPIETGTQTKTQQEPDQPGVTSDSQIKNITVLQFDGTDSEAPLVGDPVYFDHWPLMGYLYPDNPTYQNDVLKLVASSTPNTVVVLANTFDGVAASTGTSLGTFLEQDYTTLTALSGVFTTDSGDDYLRMSGSQQLSSIGTTTNVNITLKRNVAKIVVNVTNNTTGDDAVTISKVQLKDINGKYYYWTHLGTELDASVEFTDPFNPVYPNRFDNDKEDFAAAGNSGDIPRATQTYTYIVPANVRGTTSSAYQYSKGNGAPGGATRFCVFGSYGASNTPIIYTYYLGGNLTNDFNILPNYKYVYNITISEKGDANYDYRIEDMGEYKFRTDANCYMLHPPEQEGLSRTYAIPVRRAATFWNAEGVNGGVYGASTASGYTGYAMNGSTKWKARVLWSDFDLKRYLDSEDENYVGDDNKFLQFDDDPAVADGSGFDPTIPSHQKPYFRVKVQSGMKGNVVVGIYKVGSPDNILWSWHLWITDYNPDIYMEPVEHQYIYAVPHGEIHRYNNTIFNTTVPTNSTVGYKNGFVMDRHLGSTSSTTLPKVGLCYYQFGRKDPFVGSNQNGTNNNFYLDGKTLTTVLTNSSNDPEKRNVTYGSTGEADNKNIRYTVVHPMIFINRTGPWTNYQKEDLGSTDGMWEDSKYWDHNGDQLVLERKKSVYDPCPPGWKVMKKGTYDGFISSTDDPVNYNFIGSTGGILYYPEGYANRESTGGIYVFHCGQRNGNTGGYGYYTSHGFNYYSDAYSSSNGWAMQSENRSVNPSQGAYPRASAYGIRCAREDQPTQR